MKALLILLSGLVPAHGMVLFIDLNKAPKEYGACMEGAGEDNVSVVSQETNEDGAPITVDHIVHRLKELKALGTPADTIVVSGHQGGGLAFGDGGQLSSLQLTRALSGNASVTTIGMVGCYTGNVEAAERQWLLPNKNVRQVFGFPGQSPTKTANDTATLVKDYCQHSQEYARRSSKEDTCQVYPHLANLTRQSVALCSRDAIAARAYGGKGCYTYQELYDRCAEFDPGEEKLVTFMNYMSPEDPCGDYANPPRDKNSAYEDGGSPLRTYYNQVHLWRHCADQIQADRGYDMPEPTTLIRLIKYDTVKTNLARLNARELADYDQRLSDLCLDQFRLGDITNLSRAKMNERILGAVRALETKRVANRSAANEEDDATPERELAAAGNCAAPLPRPRRNCQPNAAVSARAVGVMARMLKDTFVDLTYRTSEYGATRACSSFHLVEEGAPPDFKSECIVDYQTATSL